MSPQRRAIAWTGGLVVFLFLVYVLRGVLVPFVAGMAIAYFLDPLADRLEEHGLSRLWATIAITVTFFVFLVLLLAILLPTLHSQILGFAQRLPAYLETLRENLAPLTAELQDIAPDVFDRLRDASGTYAGTLLTWAGKLLSGVWSGGVAVFDILSLLFLTPLVAFYLIRDWDLIVAKVNNWLPRQSADSIRGLFRQIDETLSGFVRGQAMVCAILGTFYALGLSLVGLDFGLVIGLGAGLISFIPYFGTMVGLIVGLGLAIAQFGDPVPIALVAVIFGIGQVMEGNFLTPKMVGEKVGLHPVWVIFALMAGGSLIGFTGVMLAVPVAAVIGVLTRFGLTRYRASILYTDTEESPVEESPDP